MCPDQTFRCCGDGAGPGWLPAVPAGAERGCHTRFLGRRHPTGRGAVPACRLAGCGPTGGRPGRTWPRGGRAGVPGSSAGRAEPSALRGHCHGQRPVPSPSRRPPRRSDLGGHPFLVAQPQNRNGLCGPKWILHRQRFMPTLGSPALRGGTWPPRSPPRCFPRTRRGRRCRPGRPGPRKARPPAARGPQARCTGAERISHARPMPLAGGMRGVFLPGDLSGPPLCPSRRLTERTGQSSRAESADSVPGRGGCVIPRSLGPRPPRAPSRARLPRPQSHPQAPPALARPGLTWSPRAALGHVPRGLSKSAW